MTHLTPAQLTELRQRIERRPGTRLFADEVVLILLDHIEELEAEIRWLEKVRNY